MVKVKINGQEHELTKGLSVLEACKTIGIEIPHFCYHPLLKVVGSCRMCKVEVNHNGRNWIDIGCKLEIADGMEILTDSPSVKKQQQATLEFLLLNHPIDCTICDEAGDCKLQNYYFSYSDQLNRALEAKIPGKKAVSIGPHVMHDSERCVLCSRCTRFLSEITHTCELGIFGMGATEQVQLKPGATLDNDYSVNIVDLCPVGALTSKDFRFKRRRWYLNSTNTICQGCSRGCNVKIDWDIHQHRSHKSNYQSNKNRTKPTFHQRIFQVTPRVNEHVNKHWICDYGRFSYKSTDQEDRLIDCVVKSESGLTEIAPNIAVKLISAGIMKAMKNRPGKVAVVVSPFLTNEEAFAVWSLFRQKLELPNIDHKLPINSEWQGDDLLKTPDPFPNRMACEWLKLEPTSDGLEISDLNEAISHGKVDTLLSILANPLDYLNEKSLQKLKNRFFLLRNLPDDLSKYVDVALPVAAWGEYQGTFTNFQGRIQKLEKALEPLGVSQPVWKWIIELSNAMKNTVRWSKNDDLLLSFGDAIPMIKGISFNSIGSQGVTIGKETKG